MAGLIVSRALADHFEKVTLVERDVLPEGPEQRRGVPQGKHTHGLLAAGRAVLEGLFPGIGEEVLAAGALSGDVLASSRWFLEGGMLARKRSDIAAFLVSRPMLESIVRRRVLALPQVTVLQGRRADEPVLSADGRRVVGVELGDEVVLADLVVDATGRGSKTPSWLEANGFMPPPEERVEVGVSYTTRLFERDVAHLGGDEAVIIPPTPAGKRGGVMLAQEGKRWTVTLMTHFSAKPPEELPAFIEFAKTLPAPYIHDVVSRAAPIGDAMCTSFPASVRRRYERLDDFPAGLLVVGDGICSFNPIYGQGMSAAALEASELGRVLSEGDDDLARRFFSRAAKIVDIPWSIAAGTDLRLPEATGPRGPGVSFVNWYLAKLHRAAHNDPELSVAFLRVANLLAPPPSIMHPRYVLRVLRAALGPSPVAATAQVSPAAPMSENAAE
jgi:2-polyprenyl-6-methoxyphenol hydroxylase-like FAD-dependent oxidoreductase